MNAHNIHFPGEIKYQRFLVEKCALTEARAYLCNNTKYTDSVVYFCKYLNRAFEYFMMSLKSVVFNSSKQCRPSIFTDITIQTNSTEQL